MASATDLIDTGASAGEFIATDVVEQMAIDAAYARSVMLPLVWIRDNRGDNALTRNYPKWPALSATRGLTDGTDMSNTAVNPTEVTCTSDETGILIAVSDLMLEVGSVDLGDYARQLGFAYQEAIDTDLTSEFADFTTSSGTSGQPLTADVWLDAIYKNELVNNQNYGDLVAVLHPIQVDDLRKDVEANTGTVFGTGAANSLMGPNPTGTPLFGVPIWTSTTCASVNTNADRQGAMFPRGSAIVYQELRAPRVEFERDASLRATEIALVGAYGHECVNVAGGIAIITDHE